MAFALAKENEAFIERMLKLGRFNNQSEVVREALRRMEREESSYLNPPPLTEQQLQEIYRPGPQADRQEQTAGRTSLKSIRKAARKHRSIEDL
jgi:putative addiction module CopG family antidote